MAETSRRSWPWKKKAQDKTSASPESVSSSPRASPQNKFGDQHDLSKRSYDHARASEDAMIQFQQTEVKLKQMSANFHTTQAELTCKDILVKQHAKVAEEAVTGWEKAEAETFALKHQLDLTTQQKLATEDRVTHLDGALKECMRQLRHVREDQEQRIHETIVKKTREYDSLREEMEAKLSEVGRHLHDARSEIAASKSEARSLTLELEESAKAFVQVNDLSARSVDEIRILQNRCESVDKECSTLKYEMQVLKKVLEIRNEEIEAERRVTENASKTQLENVKKITRLEAEGHRLRILLQKKLPGPAAVAQMKNEVVALESSSRYDPKRRRSVVVPQGSSLSPRDMSRQSDPHLGLSRDVCPDRGELNRESTVLGERLAEMDDELKMLKDVLAKRDEDLRESRLMCAKTASKLSSVEEQFRAVCKRLWKEKGSSISRSVWIKESDSGDDVNAWNEASSLLVEVDQVSLPADKGLKAVKMDLMHDFVEMEKLAMTPENECLGDEDVCADGSGTLLNRMKKDYQEKLQDRDKEVDEANRKCLAISQELLRADEKLVALQARNRANEADLIALQEKLDNVGKKHDDDEGIRDGNITRELEDLVEAQSLSVRSGATHDAVMYGLGNENQIGGAGRENIGGYESSRNSSEVKYEVHEDLISILSDADSNGSNPGSSSLFATVRRFVQVVAAVVDATGMEHAIFNCKPQRENASLLKSPTDPGKLDLTRELRSLVKMSMRLQHAKTEVAPFLGNLTAVLSFLVQIVTSIRNGNHAAAEKTILLDLKSERRNDDELQSIGLETSFQECPSQVEIGSLQDAFKSENIEEIVTSEGMRVLLQDRGLISTGLQDSIGRACLDLQECSISGREVGEASFSIQKMGTVTEREIQGENLGRQTAFHQFLDGGHHQPSRPGDSGSTSTSSPGSSERETPVWELKGSHDKGLPSHVEDFHSTKDRELQSAAPNLAANDLGLQLKTLSACGYRSSDCCDSSSDMAGDAEIINHSGFDGDSVL